MPESPPFAAPRGRLTIFLGTGPGSGKTIAMLRKARALMRAGKEVVASCVITEGRAETEELLKGIPLAPQNETPTDARGGDVNLDALILWRPHLVLFDRLAHPNPAGCRHPKRHQDVRELLDAGIDVFTTLNVQELESRRDILRKQIGLEAKESVPDSLLDEAYAIDPLEGPCSDEKTAIVLRETMREVMADRKKRSTAEHNQSRDAKPDQKEGTDRLMVAIGASPHSAELLRWTRRQASRLNASWFAVAVETPRELPPEDAQRRSTHLALAHQLGAEVVLTSGSEIGPALLKAATEYGVTQIILGKPGGGAFKFFWKRRTPVDWIIANSGQIDVHLVRTEQLFKERPATAAPVHLKRWHQHLAALGIAAAATVAGLILSPLAGYWSVALVYLLTVTIAGVMLRRGPTLFLAALNGLVWNFLFIPPLYTFEIGKPHDLMMFGMFFIVALVIGHLTTRLREREQLEQRREARATALYQLTKRLAAAISREQAVLEVVARLNALFGVRAAVILRDDAGEFSGSPHKGSAWELPEIDAEAALWAFQKKRIAGNGTETLPEAEGMHLPLLVADRVEGVLSVECKQREPFSPEQRQLLEAFASQLAIVAEIQRLAVARRRAQVLAEAEKLQKTLFDSVSHELKTPVAAIGAALEQPSVDHEEIRKANDRLRRTVEQLLSATRIESGMLKTVPEWCEVGEILREACSATGKAGEIEIEAAPEGFPVRVDFGLTAQILTTLLENATTHGAGSGPVRLSVSREQEAAVFTVRDHGPGIPAGAEEAVFRRFYRGPGTPVGGLGLGLSNARQLAEAQGGTLTASNLPEGGAAFVLRLPSGGELRLPE